MLSIIHHLENISNVPYRFKKEFPINCETQKKIETEIFYLDVILPIY